MSDPAAEMNKHVKGALMGALGVLFLANADDADFARRAVFDYGAYSVLMASQLVRGKLQAGAWLIALLLLACRSIRAVVDVTLLARRSFR